MISKVKIILFILFWSISLETFAQNNSYDPNHLFSVEELKADLQTIRQKLEGKHPNLYSYIAKPELNLFFDSLQNSITKPQTELQFYNLITLLNSKIKDGHTMILPSEERRNYFQTQGKYFPFTIVARLNQLFVNMNCSADTSIKEGFQLLSINGMSTKEILQFLVARQICDGNPNTYPYWILTNYFYSYYSFSFGNPSSFSVVFKNANEESQTKNVQALSKDSIRFYKQKRYASRIVSTIEKQGIILDIDKTKSIATLTCKSFDKSILSNTYKQNFKEEFSKAFVEMQNKQVQNLIVDVRDNQGGNFEPGTLLLSYLITAPVDYLPNSGQSQLLKPAKNNFKGNLYVLINGGCFSVTSIISSYLAKAKRAIFIGEETAGNQIILSGDPNNRTLPNTKIVYEIATNSYVIHQTKNDGSGILPNYFVQPTIADLVSNNDIVKAFALKLIR
jgi:hypothetical protein